MNQPLVDLGAPVADPLEEVETEPWRRCAAQPPPTSQPPEPTRPRWERVALAATLSLLLGAVAGWAMARSTAATPGAPGPSGSLPANVAQAAELFTSLFLSGDTPDLGSTPIFSGETPQPSGSWINDTAAIAGVEVADELWEVTVAVAALEPTGGAFVPAPLAYFVVPISVAGEIPAAIDQPRRVPAPEPAPRPNLQLSEVADDQASTATQFIQLLLTADPSVARLLSIPNDIELFRTQPYVTVSASVLGADSQGRVAVGVVATTDQGVVHNLGYYVTLTPDAGAWKVSDLGGAVL